MGTSCVNWTFEDNAWSFSKSEKIRTSLSGPTTMTQPKSHISQFCLMSTLTEDNCITDVHTASECIQRWLECLYEQTCLLKLLSLWKKNHNSNLVQRASFCLWSGAKQKYSFLEANDLHTASKQTVQVMLNWNVNCILDKRLNFFKLCCISILRTVQFLFSLSQNKLAFGLHTGSLEANCSFEWLFARFSSLYLKAFYLQLQCTNNWSTMKLPFLCIQPFTSTSSHTGNGTTSFL